MQRSLVTGCVLGWAVLLAACGATTDQARDPVRFESQTVDLTVGIFPFLAPAALDALYGPLVVELGRELDLTTRLQTAVTYEVYTERLAEGAYDVALVQPFDLVRAVDDLGFEPLAHLGPSLRAVVVRSPSSQADALTDLRGGLVATPPTGAAVTQLFTAQLARDGLVVGRDLETLPLASHSACLAATTVGDADACVTAAVPLRTFESERGARLTVVAVSDDITPTGWVARPGLDRDTMDDVADFLVGLHRTDAGERVLEGIGIDRFRPLEDGDYDDVRALIDLLRSP